MKYDTALFIDCFFPVRHDAAVRSVQIDFFLIAISIRDRLIAQPYLEQIKQV